MVGIVLGSELGNVEDEGWIEMDGFSDGSGVGSPLRLGPELGEIDGSALKLGLMLGETDGLPLKLGPRLGGVEGAPLKLGIILGMTDGSVVIDGDSEGVDVGQWLAEGFVDGWVFSLNGKVIFLKSWSISIKAYFH